MNEELEALNILRENHIYFIKKRYEKLDKDTLQNIINRKLARWDILEEALKLNEPMKPMLDENNNHRCARCHHIVDNHYCSDCGGAVDWSDEK